MHALGRLMRRLDGFQQRHRVLAVLVALQKKAGEDNAGVLVANLAYAGFVAIFPLLLILVTVLGLVVGDNTATARAIERSALAQFPIIGSELLKNIQAMRRASVLGLAVGLLGLSWGAIGLGQSALLAMAQIWDVPVAERWGFWKRQARGLAFLALLGGGLLATGSLSSFSLLARHSAAIGAAGVALSAAANVALYLGIFRVLTPERVRTGALVPGAVVGGVSWSLLESLGGYLVGRGLRHTTPVYGFFAIVLGLLAWLYLAARVSVYAAELNAVRAHRLWPRSLIGPARTDADRRALALLAERSARTHDAPQAAPGALGQRP